MTDLETERLVLRPLSRDDWIGLSVPHFLLNVLPAVEVGWRQLPAR